ncbi:MAG: hypothetical protein MW690_001083 [Methanophagales archaeon]|nr:hypothetical protein [Methanophagales archaeon]
MGYTKETIRVYREVEGEMTIYRSKVQIISYEGARGEIAAHIRTVQVGL